MQTILEQQTDLPALLEGAQYEGEMRIQCSDGEVFGSEAETNKRSPLNVDGVELGVSADAVVEFIREGRKHLDR